MHNLKLWRLVATGAIDNSGQKIIQRLGCDIPCQELQQLTRAFKDYDADGSFLVTDKFERERARYICFKGKIFWGIEKAADGAILARWRQGIRKAV